jgi:hypothetical protein
MRAWARRELEHEAAPPTMNNIGPVPSPSCGATRSGAQRAPRPPRCCRGRPPAPRQRQCWPEVADGQARALQDGAAPSPRPQPTAGRASRRRTRRLRRVPPVQSAGRPTAWPYASAALPQPRTGCAVPAATSTPESHHPRGQLPGQPHLLIGKSTSCATPSCAGEPAPRGPPRVPPAV